MAETYTTSVIPSNKTYSIESSYRTAINNMDSGAEVRRRLLRFGKRTFTLGYNKKSKANRDTIHDFFVARFGSYEAFWFLDFDSASWYDEYIGRGTGAALTIDLHTKTTTAYAIYVDGVLKTGGGTDYTFVSGGGTAGVDRIAWVNVPAAGTLLTGNLTGFLRIKGRFLNDSWKETHPDVSTRHSFEVSIHEVQW